MELVFATNNANKIKEIGRLVHGVSILSLKQIGCSEEIPENQPTIEGNASQKSNYIYTNYHINCFADDTGLEIEALNGEPGVYSARYAGEDCNSENNISKVLQALQGVENRKARFKTVISLIIGGKETLFEGIVNGTILERKRGGNGFGYDPIFQTEGYSLSFAEMTLDEKNKISHRALAVKKLVGFLRVLLKIKPL